jgi:hypothetical protein
LFLLCDKFQLILSLPKLSCRWSMKNMQKES